MGKLSFHHLKWFCCRQKKPALNIYRAVGVDNKFFGCQFARPLWYGMITSLLTDGHPFKAKLLYIFTISVWMETSFFTLCCAFYFLCQRTKSLPKCASEKEKHFCNPYALLHQTNTRPGYSPARAVALPDLRASFPVPSSPYISGVLFS